MPFMGTDLGKLMKHEKLSEDRIQFLVYQMLKGLKVRVPGVEGPAPGWSLAVRSQCADMADPLSVPTVYPRCWRHSQGESWWWWELPLAVWVFGGSTPRTFRFPPGRAQWGPAGMSHTACIQPWGPAPHPRQSVCSQARLLPHFLPWAPAGGLHLPSAPRT